VLRALNAIRIADLEVNGEDNMQSTKIAVMFGCVFLLAVSARADKVTSDYDHAVNFSNYHTFMWIREPESGDPFMGKRIMTAVNAELEARGMRQVSDGADLAVGANVATEEKHTWQTYYDGSDWWWGGGWSWTTERTYEVGTLTVDLFDAHTRKLVWQGVGIATVPSKPEKRTRRNNKVIEKMFRAFPGGVSE
jgi:hypothetical protein